METAKVDIRKLQTLNDCINRTIEALNQVRLSVHAGGLGHSSPMSLQGINPAFYGGYPGAYGAFQTPFGYPQQAAGVVPPQFAGINPMAAAAWQSQLVGGQGLPQGLGHTGWDPRFGQAYGQGFGQEWNDPYATARLAQTFPFVHWGQSPFAWPNV